MFNQNPQTIQKTFIYINAIRLPVIATIPTYILNSGFKYPRTVKNERLSQDSNVNLLVHLHFDNRTDILWIFFGTYLSLRSSHSLISQVLRLTWRPFIAHRYSGVGENEYSQRDDELQGHQGQRVIIVLGLIQPFFITNVSVGEVMRERVSIIIKVLF